MTHLTRHDDERLLRMLDLHFGEMMPYRAIGEAMGASRSAVAGQIDRVKKAIVYDCKCKKPENKDGGMQRGWWAND